MYVYGWTPHPTLILSAIEHFEITSLDMPFYYLAGDSVFETFAFFS